MPAKTRKPEVCLPAGKTEAVNVQIPPNFQVSSAETATLMRVLRFMRRRRSWMAPFVEWLVAQEGKLSDGNNIVPIDDAMAVLKDIKGLLSWEDKLESWKDDEHRPLRAFFGQSFFPDEMARESRAACVLVDADEAVQFTELVRLWRLEHPAPDPNRRAWAAQHAPKGRTQRELEAETGDTEDDD